MAKISKKDLVSIIIPIYNAEKYLETCLDSLVNQSYKSIEIICVDDGSKDESLSILKNYQKKDHRIKILTQKNSGVSVARNLGLNNALGFYIMFVDSDDFVDPKMVEILLKNIQNTNADVVQCTSYHLIGKKCRKISLNDSVWSGKKILELQQSIFLNNDLTNPSYGAIRWVCSKIFKKNILKDLYFNEKIYLLEDGLFMFQVLHQVNKYVCISNPLYYYRILPESSSNSLKKDTLKQYNLVLKELYLLVQTDKLSSQCYYKFGYECLCSYIAKTIRSRMLKKSEKILTLKEVIFNETFENILSNIDTQFLSFKEKVAFSLIKRKKVLQLYYLYKFIYFFKNKS